MATLLHVSLSSDVCHVRKDEGNLKISAATEPDILMVNVFNVAKLTTIEKLNFVITNNLTSILFDISIFT